MEEEKSKLLTELSFTLQSTQSWLNGVMERLGWTPEHLMQHDEKMVQCPVDGNHCMPPQVLESHLRYCPLVKKGFTKEELADVESSSFFYEKSTCVVPIHIDEQLECQILSSSDPSVMPAAAGASSRPASMTKFNSEMTPQGRLAIHKYCVAKAREQGAIQSVSEQELMLLETAKDREEKRPMSFLEIRAAERDLKRQRQKYKTTHTGNKSHKEILGEVIRNQMEVLAAMWREEAEEKKRPQSKELSHDRSESLSKAHDVGKHDCSSSRDDRHLDNSYRRDDRRDSKRRDYSPQRKSRQERRRDRSVSRERSRKRSRSRTKSRSRDRNERKYKTEESRSHKASSEESVKKKHKKHKHKKHKNKHKEDA